MALIIPMCNLAQASKKVIKETQVSSQNVHHLFNGKNLNGWYTFLQKSGRNNDPKKVFSVIKGMIHIGGEEWGCITTNREYNNYRLVAEFKWGGKTYAPRINNARDCGILLHSKGADGGSQGIWMRSIECQIIEGGTGDFIVVGDSSDAFQLTTTIAKEKTDDSYVYQAGGDTMKLTSDRINWYARDAGWKDIKGFRGANDIEKPMGEWNRMECIANNGELTVILNGKVVNHAFNVIPNHGHIQIQAEGAEILFRLVDILPVGKN
ncbi:MAG: DUF1080 domain-containing protein [Ferruginibacter sp.]|nr:DUF1080 domain-containing protein [Ferruginibacter sp.]